MHLLGSRMKLLVLAALLSVTASMERDLQPRVIWDPVFMSFCMQPDRNYLDYNNYGCYCGLPGSGTPVDELDRCCQTQKSCYEKVRHMRRCNFLERNPFFKVYEFTCSNKEIICSSSNTECQAFVCECDRNATICMSNVPYNASKKNIGYRKPCQD